MAIVLSFPLSFFLPYTPDIHPLLNWITAGVAALFYVVLGVRAAYQHGYDKGLRYGAYLWNGAAHEP
ncbi:MAG TPA: hypothetical protein VGP44_08325 [Gemmatimonadales bacterium]|nr:hypothetical protein [Gemmatimonadales bacterium]